MSYNLFIVKPTEFDQTQEDPFGFDSHSGRIAGRFIPFSGTIRKPSYLLFVSYVRWLQRHHLRPKSSRDAQVTRIRLEKLLVYAWKRSHESLRSSGVIGTSIRRLNPFDGGSGSWVVQNAYRIYDKAASTLVPNEVVEEYHQRFAHQLPLLQSFLSCEGTVERNQRFLDDLLTKLKRKNGGLFSGDLLLGRPFRKRLLRILREELDASEFGETLVRQMFSRPRGAAKILDRVLGSKNYPFRSLNKWYAAFIRAVDADIEGLDSTRLWTRADNIFNAIQEKRGLSLRPDPKCWFEPDGPRYARGPDFNDSGWAALVVRAEREEYSGVFYEFRTQALGSILRELDPHAA